MSVEESWRLRELRSFVGSQRRNLERLRVQKDDGTVEVQGV